MIVKLIPENDMEKSRMRAVEHKGVKEFFMFGVEEKDGDRKDFHDWNGNYRFLLGSLHYFTNLVTEEQNAKLEKERNERENEIALDPKTAFKQPPMIKRGSQPDSKIVEVINPENVEQMEQNLKSDAKIFQFQQPVANVPLKNDGEVNDGFDTSPEVEEKEEEAGD